MNDKVAAMVKFMCLTVENLYAYNISIDSAVAYIIMTNVQNNCNTNFT